MKTGAGGNWRRSDEKFDASIVKQTSGVSCVSALGEMLLKNRGISISQKKIRDIIGEPADVGSLAEAMNDFDISDDGFVWRGFATIDESLEILLRHHKNWGVILINYYLDKSGHAVFIDGQTENQLIKIRGPFDQTAYNMTKGDFFNHWGGEVIVRWYPQKI